MKCVFLVPCVKTKRKSPHPAAELYVSDLFQKARKLVEATGYPWFILSAKHRLLAPDKVIEPYEKTLNEMSTRERIAWAEEVKQQMDSRLPNADAVVVLAGQKYREYLMPYLKKRFTNVTVPMKGLGIGQQLKWLKKARIEDILPR